MRYRMTISPRAPRRHAGYLVGLLVSAIVIPAVMGLSELANVVTHAAAAGIVAL